MTLILNEIHVLNGLANTMLVAAANRRISKPDGSYDSTRRKLFPIPHLLRNNASGFHICGYRKDGLPEFWSLTNMGALKDFQHVDCKEKYSQPSADFLERDACQQFGWDGVDPASAKNGIFTYRNGDFRGHVAFWEALDKAFSMLIQFPDFKRFTSPKDYGDYVKFKFEVSSVPTLTGGASISC